MAGSIWLLYSVIQWFSSILRPFRGRLSKLLLMEEIRIFFCLPGLFLTCDWWWLQAVGLLSLQQAGTGSESRVRSLWAQSSVKRLERNQIPQCKPPHQELPVTICSLLFSRESTDLFLSLRNHFHDQVYHWRKWIQGHILIVGHFKLLLVNTKNDSKKAVIHGSQNTMT